MNHILSTLLLSSIQLNACELLSRMNYKRQYMLILILFMIKSQKKKIDVQGNNLK